jgi:hypothetical protein
MLYLIGHHNDGDDWAVDGIFTNEKDAVKNCSLNGFVMPVPINEKLQDADIQVGYTKVKAVEE